MIFGKPHYKIEQEKNDQIREKYYNKIYINFAWFIKKMSNGEIVFLETYVFIPRCEKNRFGEYIRFKDRDITMTIPTFKKFEKDCTIYRDFEFVKTI